MPIYRSERKFSISSASSLDRLGKNKFKRVRHPRNRFKNRCFVQRRNGSSEWVVISQDGDKMSFQANSQMTKNFKKIHTIGKGGFGTVVKVKDNYDNGFYAIKCILLNLMDTQSNIMKEVKLLSQLIHDNIVRYYGTWTDDCTVDEARADDEETEGFSETRSFNRNSSIDIVFQDESNVSADPPSKSGLTPVQVLCIKMEFCKTTLADAIKKNLYEKHFRAWKLFWEIVQGLVYLNKKGIIHRDLKPENIFLDAEDRVKIGDFGLATKICRRSCSKEQFTNSLSAEVGTYFYRAPELNLIPEGSRAKYGQEVDMYSLGIILFEMFHPPFSTDSERYHVLTNLREKEITMPKEFVEDEKNAELIPFIRLLLNHNVNARPTCANLLAMKKPKQLTNNRKSFQKQMKRKENINTQPAYVVPFHSFRLDNVKYGGDILKLQSTTKNDNLKRYLWEKYHQDIQRGLTNSSSKGYFSNLLMKFQQERTFELPCIAGPIEAVTFPEVKKAILKMTGYPDRQIPRIVKPLVKFFNEIISSNSEIRNVLQNVENIDGLQLSNLTESQFSKTVDIIKQSWENVLALRLAQLVRRNPCQYSSGVGTNGAINCLKVQMERYRLLKKDVHLLFIRLEKDQVPPELIWAALRAELVPEQYIDLMKDTGTLRPTISLNSMHSSALSSLLFNTVVNYIAEDIHQPATWKLLYENNIVLASEMAVELHNDFYSWLKRLESGGLNVVRKEIEFFGFQFSRGEIPVTNFVLAGALPPPLDVVVNRLLE